MIRYNEKEQTFHLAADRISYVIGIWKGAIPVHLYHGSRLSGDTFAWTLEAPYRRSERLLRPAPGAPDFSPEYLPLEYPTRGTGDFRPAALETFSPSGDTTCELRYRGYEIRAGKLPIPGLPSSYTEEGDRAETLILLLEDPAIDLTVRLFYTVFEEYDVIARHTELTNKGDKPLTLNNAMSFSTDCPQGYDDLIRLSGTALREKHIVRSPVTNGIQAVESVRGVSSHQQSPFLVLTDRATEENSGRALGLCLVYSGNFLARVDSDCYGSCRVQIGLHPDTFRWVLTPGETFHTPEALAAFSDEGLNGLSHIFHRILRERVARGAWRDRPRPILLNTWEACYFDFTHETVTRLGKLAAETGIELLVLDDGWFGHRDNDKSSLGDWYENRTKLPRGLKGLAEDLKAMGLRTGIWFEPEMISPDSDLYRSHPDWCIHAGNRTRHTWRSQLVLDLTRPEVRDYLYDRIGGILSEAEISYVKWDNNRRITEPGSALIPPERAGEFYHRYMLGLYDLLERLTKHFPEVLFENCASGGARFDPGMMHYFSQTWASDDTDAVERLKIQYGTSLWMPPCFITSHISASPNHQLGRETPLRFRARVTQAFNAGFELDLNCLTQEELNALREEISELKRLRDLTFSGEYSRLKSPFSGTDCAWQTVREDRSETVIWYFEPYAAPEDAYGRVYPVGLKPDAYYEGAVEGALLTGAQIMHMGLSLPGKGRDRYSRVWHLKLVRELQRSVSEWER